MLAIKPINGLINGLCTVLQHPVYVNSQLLWWVDHLFQLFDTLNTWVIILVFIAEPNISGVSRLASLDGIIFRLDAKTTVRYHLRLDSTSSWQHGSNHLMLEGVHGEDYEKENLPELLNLCIRVKASSFSLASRSSSLISLPFWHTRLRFLP